MTWPWPHWVLVFTTAIPSFSVATDILQVFEVLHWYTISPFFIHSFNVLYFCKGTAVLPRFVSVFVILTKIAFETKPTSKCKLYKMGRKQNSTPVPHFLIKANIIQNAAWSMAERVLWRRNNVAAALEFDIHLYFYMTGQDYHIFLTGNPLNNWQD